MTEKPRIIYQAPSEGIFTISGVVYRGKTETYQLSEKMTPEIAQDKLSELYETEKQKGNPHPTDAPLIWAIASRAYELRDEAQESEKLRQFLRQGFRQCPNTLTRVVYNHSESDKVIHNHGTSDEYFLNENVVGADGWIKDISDKQVLESLIGTQDINKINNVSQWFNDTDSSLWRLNKKPNSFRLLKFYTLYSSNRYF